MRSSGPVTKPCSPMRRGSNRDGRDRQRSGSEPGIHEAAMALHFRARIQDFIDLIHVFPTMAEALKIVAISRYKDPGKLSCCAE